MKVVCYNLRYENDYDVTNSFTNRKPFILSKIMSEQPDIIGFQEVLPQMAVWLKEVLTGYYVIGHGRDSDYNGEQMVLAYRKDRLNLHSMETFWLSPTPHNPGSRFHEQSPCPRTCIAAVFYSDESKKLFRIVNTHLDHESAFAREEGLSLIVSYLQAADQKHALPTLLMGDFNMTPGSAEFDVLHNYGILSELTATISGTFHDFGKLASPIKIDYIFGTDGFTLRNVSLWDDTRDGLYLSDHYPVCVALD